MSEAIPPPNSGNGSGSGPVAPVATLPLSDDDSGVEVVPALGSVIADKYRIEELIARGGMGAVFMATHLVSGKRVALKWMLPTLGQVPGAKERFVREACATARIEHPNVIDIYDVGSDRGSVYLVMELLRGETLAEYLQRSTTVGPMEAVQLLMPALRGVAAAHSHHVIHRDLKPDNIFLCRSVDGEPRETRVLDFGISKIGAADGRDLSLTRSGAVMGTPYYMSPEQVRGAKDVDERGDVYAFGVILYEMLTGQRPFDAETYNQLILKIATEDPLPIAALNPLIDRKLIAVVERAMAREPSARYASIEELAVALEAFSGGTLFRASTVRILTPAADSGEHAFQPALIRRKAARPLRSRSFVMLGIALGCLGTAVGLWGMSRSRAKRAAVAAPAQVESIAPAAAVAVPKLETDVSASSKPDPESSAGAVPAAPEVVASPIPEPTKPVAPEREPERAPERARKAKGVARTGAGEEKSAERPAAEVPRIVEPVQAAPRPAAASGRRKLPANWDDDLEIPALPAAATPSPAGRIDASDLR